MFGFGIEELLIAAIAAIAGLLVISRLPVWHYPACYFLLQYLGGQVLSLPRVRYIIAMQLALISVLYVFAMLRRGHRPKPVKTALGQYLALASVTIICLLGISAGCGLLNGYSPVQVMIDLDKYLEIFILYFFLKACVDSLDYLYRGVRSLALVMTALAAVEFFTTQRGGTGLNMIMSIAPIVLAMGVCSKFRHYILLTLLSLAVVFFSQTRTYIIGFLFGVGLLLLLVGGQQRAKVCRATVPTTFAFAPLAVIWMPQKLEGVLHRFLELTAGFRAAGGYRVYEIEVAMQKLMEHPFVGKGLGYTEYLYIYTMGFFEWGSFLHCAYVEVLLKNGILLGVGILLCLVLVLGACLRFFGRLKAQSAEVHAICMSGLCATLGWVLVYAFAPLSSYGSAFVGLSIALIAYNLYSAEQSRGSAPVPGQPCAAASAEN